MGLSVGYARVSTVGQNLDVQLNRLAECDRIYKEKVSAGSTKNRPELLKALDFVREDDVFIVTKLDRLARSVIDLSHIVQRLEEKKVDLVVIDQGIDTTNIYGKLQFHILAAIGEFERGLIRERSREGRQRAIDQGVIFGARPKLTDQEIEDLVIDYETPGLSRRELAKRYGISKSTLYRTYADYKQELERGLEIEIVFE